MKRLKAYVIISVAYVLACLVFVAVFKTMSGAVDGNFKKLLGVILIADAAATVIIWVFGLAFGNSSFYDPYWSFFPWFIALFLMNYWNAFGVGNLVLFGALSLWSWRLTVNWAYTCSDITTQDWRYVDFKEKLDVPLWHVTNFFGINLMPTVLVFLGLVPAIVFIQLNLPLSAGVIIGAVIIVVGTILEAVADVQMHRFKKNNQDGAVLQTGLWQYSRHPNYLGEILIWVGVYAALAVSAPSYAHFAAGWVLIAALFIFISIPMMEKRQIARRPLYAEYVERTSRLIPFPPRKKQ